MTEFELQVKNYRCFPDEKPLQFKIAPGFTSFVGVNNSGKSSVLRFFWEFRSLLAHLAQPTGNLINAFNGQPQSPTSLSVASGEQAFSKLNTRDIEVRYTWQAAPGWDPTRGSMRHELTISMPRPSNSYVLSASVDGVPLKVTGNEDFEGTYLRSSGERIIDLSPFWDMCRFMSNAMYLGPFRNTINVGATERYFDIAVGQQFTQEFHQYKSGGDPSHNEAVYQLTQDIKRIFGFDQLEINADPDRKALQLFIDGRSFRLSELGTGLAQFIIVLANVLVRRPAVVLIDEPEASLHPTLQLDFLTTLATYATEASVIFATHNLGLARAASDRIYSCKRLSLGVNEVRPLEATSHLAEFLGELGFSAYRDLGFDKVILVEGPADLKAVQQFLRMYKKDHTVVLLPLGGSSMINAKAEAELVEISRITPQVTSLIDSERAGPNVDISGDRGAFLKSCKKLGIGAHVLERRAIENYFTDAAVKRALGPKYSALSEFGSLAEAQPGWSKRENWRIVREMSRDDIVGTDLDKFLEDL